MELYVKLNEEGHNNLEQAQSYASWIRYNWDHVPHVLLHVVLMCKFPIYHYYLSYL